MNNGIHLYEFMSVISLRVECPCPQGYIILVLLQHPISCLFLQVVFAFSPFQRSHFQQLSVSVQQPRGEWRVRGDVWHCILMILIKALFA